MERRVLENSPARTDPCSPGGYPSQQQQEPWRTRYQPCSKWSPRNTNQRMEDGEVPLTSPRLAHKSHNLARGQLQGEVLEYDEARSAGVAGRGQESPSQMRFPALSALRLLTGPCSQEAFTRMPADFPSFSAPKTLLLSLPLAHQC